MLIIGLVCLLLGFLLHVPILWVIGVVLCVVGLILLLIGHARPASYSGRRYWY